MKLFVITGTPDKPETTLLCGLAKAGHQILVAGEPRENEYRWLTEAGIVVVPFTINSRLDLKALKEAKKLIAEFTPDGVYAFTARAVSIMILATWGKRIKRFAYRGVMGNVSRWDPASWLTFLSPGLNAVSCVSNAVRESLLAAGVSANKLVTIHKGHSPLWYTGSWTRQDRSQYGLKEDEFVVICIANARPGKGVDDVVNAVTGMPSSVSIRLVLVGEIKDPALQALLPHERVITLGSVPDAWKLLPLADCAILASKRQEGLPKTVIEAMIQGVPVIVTRVGGMKELVRHEVDGIMVPPAHAEILRDALNFMYEHPEKRKEFGENSRQRILSDFTPQQTLDKTLRMLEAF